MAIARNPEQSLLLAPGFRPDVDLILQNGLAAFGVPGSGKSNLVSLLVEQFARYLLPQVILDTEDEYQALLPALPHGVLADCTGIPSAREILGKGLQVIVNLKSWDSREDAALAMCALVDDLFSYASQQAATDRVPLALILDEAAQWLPQKAVSYLSKETKARLFDTFNNLGTRGRKYGLRPFIATQYVSQIQKDIIRSCSLRVFMRQTEVIDLDRYADYLKPFSPEQRRMVSAFQPGQAIIHGLPDGSQPVVRFNEQQTEHMSTTPKAHAAIAKFANTNINFDALQIRAYGSELTPPAITPDEKTYSQSEVLAILKISRGQLYIVRNLVGVVTARSTEDTRASLYTESQLAQLKKQVKKMAAKQQARA